MCSGSARSHAAETFPKVVCVISSVVLHRDGRLPTQYVFVKKVIYGWTSSGSSRGHYVQHAVYRRRVMKYASRYLVNISRNITRRKINPSQCAPESQTCTALGTKENYGHARSTCGSRCNDRVNLGCSCGQFTIHNGDCEHPRIFFWSQKTTSSQYPSYLTSWVTVALPRLVKIWQNAPWKLRSAIALPNNSVSIDATCIFFVEGPVVSQCRQFLTVWVITDLPSCS